MAFDPDRVSTVTVDSYSTLVDVETAEQALADAVDESEPVSNRWRQRSLAYTFVANATDAYQPFYEMNRDALQYALDAHGVDLSVEKRDEILAVYHELDVFGDVRDVRVDRKGLPWEPFDGEPDYTVESFHELAEALGA